MSSLSFSLPVCLLAASVCVSWGQSAPAGGAPNAPASPPKAAAPDSPAKFKPDTVVASIQGKPVTAGEIETFIAGFPPQVRQSYYSSPRETVRQYLIFRHIADMAVAGGLDKETPYKEQLAFMRNQILWQAQINKVSAESNAIPEDFKKYYEEHKDKYVQTRLKAIYIPYSNNPEAAAGSGAKVPLTEAQAKTRADEVVKLARAGTDFTELVKKYSEDPNSAEKGGDLPPMSKSDAIPEAIKTAVFALKQGEISEPVKHTNGYFIFRSEGVTTIPLDEKLKGEINTELKSERVRNWLQKTDKEANVQIENEGFFLSQQQQQQPPAGQGQPGMPPGAAPPRQ